MGAPYYSTTLWLCLNRYSYTPGLHPGLRIFKPFRLWLFECPIKEEALFQKANPEQLHPD